VAHPYPSVGSPVYRPKKLPRVLRRQLPVLRLCAGIVILGLAVISVTWRNLTHERLSLDVGVQRTHIEVLNKEIQHFEGLIETEASFPKISQWAKEQHGWRPLPNSVRDLRIPENRLTPAAKQEAKRLEAYR